MGVLEETIGVRPWRMPLSLFFMATACRLRRKSFVLLDVGAEPIENWLSRALCVVTARLATHLSYRDRWSAEAMCKAGDRTSRMVAPDLAFAHPARTCADPQSGLVVVGVMAYYGKRDDPVKGAQVRRTYVASLTKALVHLVDAGDAVVLLGGDRVDNDVARDVQAAVRMDRPDLAPEAIAVREPTTFDELTDLMGRAEAVVASRFHNLICALRLARPTVSLGYAQKQSCLMRELGLEEYCQDILRLDADHLVAQLRAARAQGSLISARIREATGGYAGDVTSLLEEMAAATSGLREARSARRDE
jgi:polysaccharide pyruvyl transferase WcaK-like protein